MSLLLLINTTSNNDNNNHYNSISLLRSARHRRVHGHLPPVRPGRPRRAALYLYMYNSNEHNSNSDSDTSNATINDKHANI